MRFNFLESCFLASFLFIFMSPLLVGADEPTGISGALKGEFFKESLGETGAKIKPKEEPTTATIARQIGNIIQNILQFLGIIILIMIIYAGVLWLTAGGSPEKATKAKGILFNAFMGALIIGAAYAITAAILVATQ